jgi:hypothetical protein
MSPNGIIQSINESSIDTSDNNNNNKDNSDNVISNVITVPLHWLICNGCNTVYDIVQKSISIYQYLHSQLLQVSTAMDTGPTSGIHISKSTYNAVNDCSNSTRQLLLLFSTISSISSYIFIQDNSYSTNTNTNTTTSHGSSECRISKYSYVDLYCNVILPILFDNNLNILIHMTEDNSKNMFYLHQSLEMENSHLLNIINKLLGKYVVVDR